MNGYRPFTREMEPYLLVRAARHLGVAPWDLAAQPVFWRDWALLCQKVAADTEAHQINKARR